MTATRGYIKLARKLFVDDPWWGEPRTFSRFEAWVDLLQLAAWRDREYHTASGAVALKRGEFVASVRYLGTRWGWSAKKVHGFLADAVKRERLRKHDEKQVGTVYLVVNYERYQGGGGDEETATETQAETQKKHRGNKKEEVKQYSTKGAVAPWMGDVRQLWQRRYQANPHEMAVKVLRPLVEAHGIAEVVARLDVYLAQTPARFVDLPKFASTWGEWAPKVVERSRASNGQVLLTPDEQAAERAREMEFFNARRVARGEAPLAA